MFFLEGGATIMNVPAGFTNGFSFYYVMSSPNVGSVEVYDDLNGTGNLLASQGFNGNPLGTVGGDPTGVFDLWLPVGVTFSGTAKSVVFSGVANQCGFDDITFGSENPGQTDVPIPNWALILGAMLIAAFIGIRAFFLRRA